VVGISESKRGAMQLMIIALTRNQSHLTQAPQTYCCPDHPLAPYHDNGSLTAAAPKVTGAEKPCLSYADWHAVCVVTFDAQGEVCSIRQAGQLQAAWRCHLLHSPDEGHETTAKREFRMRQVVWSDFAQMVVSRPPPSSALSSGRCCAATSQIL
jgi:hypothetical protein